MLDLRWLGVCALAGLLLCGVLFFGVVSTGCSSDDFRCYVDCHNPHASQGKLIGILESATTENQCLLAIEVYCDEGCSDLTLGCCTTGYSCGAWSN